LTQWPSEREKNPFPHLESFFPCVQDDKGAAGQWSTHLGERKEAQVTGEKQLCAAAAAAQCKQV
jgi:hypothetical protein